MRKTQTMVPVQRRVPIQDRKPDVLGVSVPFTRTVAGTQVVINAPEMAGLRDEVRGMAATLPSPTSLPGPSELIATGATQAKPPTRPTLQPELS
jgi:hypothetical protein